MAITASRFMALVMLVQTTVGCPAQGTPQQEGAEQNADHGQYGEQYRVLGQLVPQQQVPRQVTDKVLITDQLAVAFFFGQYTPLLRISRAAEPATASSLPLSDRNFAQQVVVRIIIGQQCHDTARWLWWATACPR